jgi:hypothetical protein
MSEPDAPALYGLVAEFSSPEAILAAAERAREAGYTKMDAYTPFPVTGLDEALGMQPTRLGWVVLFMGVIGALVGYFMQWYAHVVFYPLNIGGRPLNSWPNFIVITFEVTVLFAAFTAGLFMIFRNGLPQPYHPIFNAPNFAAATRDKFLLCIEATDGQFDRLKTWAFLESLGPDQVAEVQP